MDSWECSRLALRLGLRDDFTTAKSLAFGMRGDVKIHPSIVIHFDRRRNIQVSESDFLSAIVEHINRLSHDGVVGDFLLMAVAKYQHRGIDGFGVGVCRTVIPIRL